MYCSFPLAKLSAAIGVAALLGVSSVANAGLVNGSDFKKNHTTQTIDDFAWTITPGGQTFQHKGTAPYIGVGISGGRTGDEIDTNEVLIGTRLTNTFSIFSLQLGMLFDGPEYNDYNEIAKITATRIGGQVVERTLRADTATTAVWSHSGTVNNLSAAVLNSGAVWEITGDPFGGFTDFYKITFTALDSTVCDPGYFCNNQSDFTLVQLKTDLGGSITGNPVPEPASLALVGLGLLGMAVARRRRA